MNLLYKLLKFKRLEESDARLWEVLILLCIKNKISPSELAFWLTDNQKMEEIIQYQKELLLYLEGLLTTRCK